MVAQYEVEISLAKNKLLQAVLARAKKLNTLEISIDVPESYNLDPNTMVEGVSNADISGYFDLNFFNPKDWWLFTKAICSWVYESVEYRSTTYMKNTNPFSFPWDNWVWTIHTLDLPKDTLARKRAKKVCPVIESDFSNGGSIKVANYFKEIENQRALLTRKEIMAELLEDFHPLYSSDKSITEIYVSKFDPTVICVDNGIFPYDMKHGYSYARVTEIMERWLELIGQSTSVKVLGV